MKNKYTEYSKFWLGDTFSPEKVDADETYGILKLSAYRRAISNFVYILTGKNIPVRFAEKTTSMTDGNVVYIGGELAKGEFDPTVGLALHEASHIVKSDFSLIKTIWGKIPYSIIAAADGKVKTADIGELIKYTLNVVEDRYIDAWVYATAPGYRGYYEALYNRYFNLPEIRDALKSDAYRAPTIKNYKFRFTNIVNPFTDLEALPRLRKISELLDLNNILRDELSTPQGRLDLTYNIVEEIVRSVVEDKEETKSSPQKDDDAKNESGDQGEDSNESGDDSSSSGDSADNAGSSDIDDILGGMNTPSNKDGDDMNVDLDDNSKSDLSEKKIAKIEKAIAKQEAIINRTNAKTPFNTSTLNKLRVMEKSGVGIVPVGNEFGIPQYDCIVVKNLTKELMDQREFPYSNKYSSFGVNKASQAGIQDGIALGTMLGRKLQIRAEVKVTKFSRLDGGKIDRRLISGLGYDIENIFYQTKVDKYKNVHLHISVDASSSMESKWKKTMTTLVALAKAASMINNVDVVISFRSGVNISTRRDESPYIVIAYDSRKDKFSKITSLFPMLYPNGTTPEGLAFQAIMDLIPPSTQETDTYFVNMSDGEPAFSNTYIGENAALHTSKQVKKIRDNGIQVISYYIEDAIYKNSANQKCFRIMYSKDANFIDVSNITQIAHSLNKKFLAKASELV
jgi:hypothetical protein